ncbi:MAG: hypothetical protein OEV20_05535 [Actinomycetota bacterium]|nr:hypothetical protein [Actinomycetota bacterium]
MDWILLWPESPVLSLAVLWIVTVVLFWAARSAMLEVFDRLGAGVDEGLSALGDWCAAAAESLELRSRQALLAAGTLDLHRKLDREFHGIDKGFADKLERYGKLHRRLDELLQKLDDDYKQCGDSPPDVPGWSAAAQAIAQIPNPSDPNVHKVLEGIRKSSQDAEKKALAAYRDATGKRHATLGKMTGTWKEVRGLLAKMQEAVSVAMESTNRIDGYVTEYSEIRDDEEKAARMLSYSAVKLFVVSLVVLGIAIGGAFINFQLIALPMSELVPAGARIGGVPVATISALVIVLMEAAVGIFVMDMLGITELFPKLVGIPSSRRRLILGLGLAALFFLASVESSLAILREQIVEADAALKLALAGESSAIAAASHSRIPVIGQAVLGFVLPWVLAMVAIPLEMLLDSGRHVLASLGVFTLNALGHLARVIGRVFGYTAGLLASLYDVYIAVPLRIEALVRRRNGDDAADPPRRPRSARASVTGESLA